VVTENERLRIPINQNILMASPYLIMHTVHWIQQPARPLPLPVPNIQHQAKCDPGVNISATNDINVLHDTVALDNPFPISSADRTAPAMTASVCGTFVIPLSDGYTCDVIILADNIVSPQHLKS
jgi:hypothetical protein